MNNIFRCHIATERKIRRVSFKFSCFTRKTLASSVILTMFQRPCLCFLQFDHPHTFLPGQNLKFSGSSCYLIKYYLLLNLGVLSLIQNLDEDKEVHEQSHIRCGSAQTNPKSCFQLNLSRLKYVIGQTHFCSKVFERNLTSVKAFQALQANQKERNLGFCWACIHKEAFSPLLQCNNQEL